MAENKEWKDIYLIKSTPFRRETEAHFLGETVVWF